MRIQTWSKWSPALLVMGIIFWLSSQPSSELPDFEWADTLVKKSGHVVAYAALAFTYQYALGMDATARRQAWILAILYALSDEFHQSFVPGRQPSWVDVILFDNLGAGIGLWLAGILGAKRRETS